MNQNPTHNCFLDKNSESCLRPLPPDAPEIKIWCREFRKLLICSENNYATKYYFRSKASILAERRRHTYSKSWYIIHPFSKYCSYREYYMCILWYFALFRDPVILTFSNNLPLLWKVIISIFDLIILFDIGCQFFIGYENRIEKEVVLTHSKIVKRYACTYFFFDLMGALPLAQFSEIISSTSVMTVEVTLLHLLRCVRIISVIKYTRKYTRLFNLSRAQHKVCIIIVFGVYLIHLSACLMYIIHVIITNRSSNLNVTDWIEHAGIGIKSTKVSTFSKYCYCLIQATCIFFLAGHGPFRTTIERDFIIQIILQLGGMMYIILSTTIVIDMVNKGNSSENRYEEILIQINTFMAEKKLPNSVRKRILTYYTYKFNKRYFQERAILATLSDHLCYEIYVYQCRKLIDHSYLLENLPKNLVGIIIANLTSNIYLPNDVIMKVGDPAYEVFFIASGTVAVYDSQGREVFHRVDGKYFGAFDIISNGLGSLRSKSAVAIEICEIYILQKEKLQKHFLCYPSIVQKLTDEVQTWKNSINTLDNPARVKYMPKLMDKGGSKMSF